MGIADYTDAGFDRWRRGGGGHGPRGVSREWGISRGGTSLEEAFYGLHSNCVVYLGVGGESLGNYT